jgi:hypothetical protein
MPSGRISEGREGTTGEQGEAQLERRLVGRELAAVTFVRDYVQLAFDGPSLTAITPPTVRIGHRQLKPGDHGYRDALCDRIGAAVRDVSVSEGDALQIAFSDDSQFRISLRPEDYSGPEAVIVRDGEWWWVK